MRLISSLHVPSSRCNDTGRPPDEDPGAALPLLEPCGLGPCLEIAAI
jgi:hypothetical protein